MSDQNTVLVPLTQGKFAIIDAEDAEEILRHKWCFLRGGYAVRRGKLDGQDRRGTIYMHRQITGALRGQEIDHVNGQKLDNRRENLRIATRGQNSANAGPRRNNKTGFRGVFQGRDRKTWYARINVNRTSIYLGTYDDPILAALAYDNAAKKHFGEYAGVNFPSPD